MWRSKDPLMCPPLAGFGVIRTLSRRSISEEIHNNWRSSISWMQSEPSTWNDAVLGQLDGRGMINENVDPISHYRYWCPAQASAVVALTGREKEDIGGGPDVF